LYAATGFLIRTTADDLYRRVFTKINPGAGDIRTVFYLAKKDRKHGAGYAAAGTAVYVAGVLEDGVILNSQEPYAKVRRVTDVSDWFQRNGHEVAVRGLDRGARGKPGTGLILNGGVILSDSDGVQISDKPSWAHTFKELAAILGKRVITLPSKMLGFKPFCLYLAT
jgi:hypothetical protein